MHKTIDNIIGFNDKVKQSLGGEKSHPLELRSKDGYQE